MYAPPKKVIDSDDDSESEDEVPVKQVVKHEENDKPIVQIDDEEIQRLTRYFAESRVEMERKVDSVLAANENTEMLHDNTQISNILNNNPKNLKEAKIDYGPGKPVTLEIATELRQLTVHSCVQRLSEDWRKAKFIFHNDNSDLSYGLISEKNGSKGLILAVQTYILKHLMIYSNRGINGEEVTDRSWSIQRRILNPNVTECKDALIKALSDILWNVGDEKSAIVTIKIHRNVFQTPIKSKTYFPDGLTERLKMFEFEDYKKLESFIARNIDMGSSLIGDMEECKISLYNLVLIGMATPHLHNNTIYYDKDGNALIQPEIGVQQRSDIGLLYWDSDEQDEWRTIVGSMLKTPKYPIWLVIMSSQVAVLFNTNIELMNDWRLEQYFTLYFYSGLHKQETNQKFTIDTREHTNLDESISMRKKFSFLLKDVKEPDIVEAIFTKWPKCEIIDVEPSELMSLL